MGVTALPFNKWTGISRMAIGLAGATLATTCHAWSSKQFPLFDPVHQMAIERVVGNSISSSDLKILQDQQAVVDQDQKAAQSFEHAMTGIESKADTYENKRAIYIAKTEKFIADNLADAIAKRKAGNVRDAMVALGNAMHALEDATSPAHERFQPWHDNESILEVAQHVSKERLYPDSKGPDGYQAKLEGAVRLAYDIFNLKLPMPDHFFNSDGVLRLQIAPISK